MIIPGRDEAEFVHRGEDELGAGLRRIRVAVRREPRGRLDEAGEHRRFGEGDVAGGLAVIALRRRLDAVGAGAEIDAVEIELEDLVLGVFALEPERQDRLLDLARGGALLGQEEVLGELLGQRRAALGDAARGQVAEDSARDADRIDAEMVVEAPVLDRDEGLGQIGRQLLDVDRAAAGLAAVGEERAVGGEDGDVRRALRHRELVDRRQLRGVIGDDAGDRDDGPQAEHDAAIDEPRAPAAPAPFRLALGTRTLARRLVLVFASRFPASPHLASGPVLRREAQIKRPRIGARLENRLSPVTSGRHETPRMADGRIPPADMLLSTVIVAV